VLANRVLTTDPIYKKPLLPVITIRNTSGSSLLYTYDWLTDVGTTDKPFSCTVSLSQGTHGEFSISFEDANKSMESSITVGSRVRIECGKQSGSLTRLISGIVRKKGYSRGADNKVLYTISGTSTGIRLNELLTYAVSEGAKLANGAPDITDVTRKADTLLASNLSVLTGDGMLSIANLAANSDVETFVASLNIEYGELQDLANYISDQSGGEVVVDTNDLVNFRYEIKNTLFGRGFTIKNKMVTGAAAADDADDTMYLRGKSWSYEDEFFKSANYANRLYSILPADPRPSIPADLGVLGNTLQANTISAAGEVATKFRPTHTRYTASDIYVAICYTSAGSATLTPSEPILRVCRDAGGVPQNVGGIVGNIIFTVDAFQSPLPTTGSTIDNLTLANEGYYLNMITGSLGEIYLDPTKDYWLIMSNSNITGDKRIFWARNQLLTGTNTYTHGSNFSTATAGGSGWVASANTPAFAVGRYRSNVLQMWDPKAVQNIQSGLTAGQYIDSLITDASLEAKTNEAAYRNMAAQIYERARPRTLYNFPTVTAPNIPVVPGDPIVISDSVLGFSTTGNQVVLTTCGDMTYSWGDYEAPTNLNIQAIGVHQRYR